VMEEHASSCFMDNTPMDKDKMEELIKLMFNYTK
jgi:hypothetical protein